MSINTKMIETIFVYGKDIYRIQMKKTDAVNQLVTDLGMNRNSAAGYLNVFQEMMQGYPYKRTINKEATIYFLHNILQNFGPSKLSNALKAVEKHIKYYESDGKRKAIAQREIYQIFHDKLKKGNQNIYPDEIENTERLFEGVKRLVPVNSYERNPKARKLCIEYYGAICSVCNFNFKEKYGKIGSGFIHVHHLNKLSDIGKGYVVNPILDLRPVCPNCHAMLHRETPPYSIEGLKLMMRSI